MAYTHPRVAYRNKIVRVVGPVRIVTRTIKTPDREEIVTDELRGAVFENIEREGVREPVFKTRTMSPWLIGAGLASFKTREKASWTLYGGRSIANRLDLLAGVSGAGKLNFVALWRF